ncbi:hypothetical protein HHI36_004983 [Cryptolaemus montrouzieri]|uniref:Uncharacterized protein n=1 Tax=Cryptolaemus montrouzieri TaxID=559131 RepID=A0ABD2NST3_9CUCU
MDISNIIIQGPLEKIEKIPLDKLLDALNVTRDTEILPDSHILKVWNILKKEKGLNSLEVKDLERIGEFIHAIPDSDLFYLNMTNWDVVEYLGTVTKMNNHKVAILAAALINAHGLEILRNHSSINRIFGILCGFDVGVVNNIPDEEFLLIDGEIFNHLQTCSMYRTRNLLDKATKSTVFGPPQVWDANTVKKANMLMLALTPKELVSIRPPAISGMKSEIIQLMSMELIQALNTKQITKLSTEAYLIYKQKTYLSSKDVYYKSNIKCNMFMLTLILMQYRYV